MSKNLTHEEVELLLFLLKDNKAALKLVLDILWVGHVWDDLVDCDVVRSRDEINEAFIKAFRDIPNNEFYLSLPPVFMQQLNGLIISASLQYRDSTKLELGDKDERLAGLLIRNAILPIIHYIMGLVGGPDWVDEHGLTLWKTFMTRDLYFDDLVRED